MNNLDRTKPSSSFLRKLLIEPKYRIVRHLLLISILAVTALNQSFMTLRTGIEALGYWIFLQAFFLFTTYLIVCYFNLWVLLPRYLLKKRYVRYTLYLTAAIFLLVVAQTMEERTVLLQLNLLDEFYMPPRIFITILSSFALVSLCVSGGAMTVVLKRWMTDRQKVNQLEKLHIQSEVEQLKEQVSPHFLFNILNRTGILAKHQPEKASDMLIRLSQLLRYQLYDCNRERVLLSSEIKFLNNYLTLEQLYSHSFEFNIQSDKGCSLTLVSPLLFISLVQSAVNKIHELNTQTYLNILFETVDESSVTFICRCGLEDLFFNMDFAQINKRLDLLYKSHYSLTVASKEVSLKLDI